MTPGIKKWILRPLIIVLVSLVLLIGIGVSILYTEHDRIVNIALDKLNKQFQGELVIETTSISLFKHFPSVGVALHEATLYPDKTKSGTPIFSVEKLYVGVSIPDLFDKKYNIRRISLHNGVVNLVKETNGDLNILEAFNVHSETTEKSKDSTHIDIDLEKVSFAGLDLSYYDLNNGQRYRAKIEELQSHFEEDGAKMSIVLDSKAELDWTGPRDTTLFRHKKFTIDIDANYEFERSLLHIPSGSLTLDEATFAITGSANIAKESVLDLRVQGDKPDLTLITAFLPADVKQQLAPFKYDGRIYFDALVRGRISRDAVPLIEVDFGCENAWFLNTAANEKLDQLGFKGYYFNGSDHALNTSELHVTNVNARPGKGIFKGNFVMRDFTKPQIVMQLNSELELKFIGEFFGIEGIRQTTGKIKLDMDFNELLDLKMPESALSKLKEGVQSKLVVQDLSFRIPGHPLPLEHVNVHAEMRDGDIKLDSASLRIGKSDLRLRGELSDIQAFIRNRNKAVTLDLQARANKILLNDIFAYDTAIHMSEEVSNFVLGIELNTTVDQMLKPTPLPKGQFDLKILNATLKNYKHSFKDISAKLTVNDTLIQLNNLKGMVDKSDLQLTGLVKNYKLWFEDVKVGKSEISLDFKSDRFALDDILGRGTGKYVPRGYRHEEANGVVLLTKIDLRYDSVFTFAKAGISNLSGVLKNHNFAMKDISGTVKYSTNRIFALDTLKGMIGNSDFNVTMRMINDADKTIKKRTNYFYFKSNFLDVDELASYDFSPDTTRRKGDSTRRRSAPKPAVVAKADSSRHSKSYNIFTLPFAEFTANVDVGKIKYNKLWMKDVTARLRLTEDHFIHADTLGLRIADGTIGMRGQVNGSDTSKLILTSTIKVNQVDLEKVMVKLDHLGQDLVVNKNLKGILSGEITSDLRIHPNFVPIVNNSNAKMRVTIFNGSLVDFAPMQAMASYFKDKNLKLVRFDTLTNQLAFNNGTLDIPRMSINSSLGFIQLSGKQSLDLTMEYYMKIPMKMVTSVGFNALFNKKPEDVNVDQIDEIEYSDKDKKIRFVSVKVIGTPDDFKVSLGKSKRG
ncbi:MAG TPA: AsmA-like C-terminal region-containing protein [Cyclobacteriaceae bacterium]